MGIAADCWLNSLVWRKMGDIIARRVEFMKVNVDDVGLSIASLNQWIWCT